MLKRTYILGLLLLFTGCFRSPDESAYFNKKSLENPKLIGVDKFGNTWYMFEFDIADNNGIPKPYVVIYPHISNSVTNHDVIINEIRVRRNDGKETIIPIKQ